MVAGVARVPGAAGRPAELRRFAGAVSPQPVERGKRGSGQNPFRCGLSRTTTFNEVYDDDVLLRAADRDRLAAQLTRQFLTADAIERFPGGKPGSISRRHERWVDGSRLPPRSAMARKRSRSRVGVTIMDCIGSHSSLFLKRIYSENSPQNCSATTLSPVRPSHRFCQVSSPIATSIAHRRSVPNSPSAEICNVKGAILRSSAPPLSIFPLAR